jgi:Na+/H+-dicarboxylate symporter
MADFDPRLANRILWGLVFGAVAGALVLSVGAAAPQVLDAARWLSVQVLDPLGQVFLRLLFFVVMPLVFAGLRRRAAQ